jgi:hypothetical protein
MTNTHEDGRRRAVRDAVHAADAANGEPGATGDDADDATSEEQDAPGAGIERGVEPAEPNEPA